MPQTKGPNDQRTKGLSEDSINSQRVQGGKDSSAAAVAESNLSATESVKPAPTPAEPRDEAGADGAAVDSQSGAHWPDDAAESAFLADARDRGEPVSVAKVETEAIEAIDPKSLPALNELVNRIPAELRETLDELFRARFVAVKRVPKRALKN